MKKNEFFCLRFRDNGLEFIDQTRLPFEELYIHTDSVERIAEAIERLEIRGAPAIGIAAAFAMALSQKSGYSIERFETDFKRISRTRPTAVNLFWALNQMAGAFKCVEDAARAYDILKDRALSILEDDVRCCQRIAEYGQPIFKDRSNVITHCNTGMLAMGGGGTALNVIRLAYERGMVEHVYADETRPLLQGSRLTAFELRHYGVPFSVITDSMAAHIMKTCRIDLVITGADRITARGDSANKIGTYGLAVLCKYHNIPFYIAAPYTTIDSSINNGDDIIIEERAAAELFSVRGSRLSDESFPARNPSFDVTPAELIAGIITDSGLYSYPYCFK